MATNGFGSEDPFEKERPGGPPGWVWRETGARGPHWYPPVVEGPVDREAEHLALCPLDADGEPCEAVAFAAAGEGDALVAELVDRSPGTRASVERLFEASFEELGAPAIFELAYEHSQSTANREYANPAWFYAPALK